MKTNKYTHPPPPYEYEEVVINGKRYLRNISKPYFLNTDKTAKLYKALPDEDAKAYISDHLLQTCKYRQDHQELNIGTFNACMTRLSLRMKEGLCNADGRYIGMITGDSMPTDTERRKLVRKYIKKQFKSDIDMDILLLQEVDYTLCKSIRNPIAFCEQDTDSNAGGNAIIVSNTMQIVSYEAIYDVWDTGQKLVGVKATIMHNNQLLRVANVHLDTIHAKYTLPMLRDSIIPTVDVLGGDFNLTSSVIVEAIPDKLTELTTDSRIDHIFEIK